MTERRFREIYHLTEDQLRLYGRDYFSPSSAVPVICLPGLTRNTRDFESLAPWLAQSRRVICFDYRGRGRSDYAADPTTYRVDVEVDDTLQFLDALGIKRFAAIGTSRGALVGLFMAQRAPERLAGLFFNDIGPVLEVEGLLRIRSYLGVASTSPDWTRLTQSISRHHPGFSGLTLTDWLVVAHRLYRDEAGMPVLDYDLNLTVTFPTVEQLTTQKLPNLWPVYDELPQVPIHVVRGEHSDLLSLKTAKAMVERRAHTKLTVIPGRGHAPFLDEALSRQAITSWLAEVDRHKA